MRKPLILALAAATVLAGCGTVRESRLNPFNWFGGGREVAVAPGTANPLMPRRGIADRAPDEYSGIPVQQVIELNIEPTPSGAIVHAVGLGQREGAFDVRLVPADPAERPGADGVLTYSFEALYPSVSAPGTPITRRINAARSLKSEQLRDVRAIRVVSATNVMESRRR